MNTLNRILLLSIVSLLNATDIVIKTDGTASSGNGISFQNSSSTEIFAIEADGEIQAAQGRIKDKTGYLAPVGSMMMYAGSSAPTGWLLCDGTAISRTTYSDLFSAISTTYGTGDGSSTFNTPNMGGKGPMGYLSSNTAFDALAETSGEETHTLTESEMPSHTHTVVSRNPAHSSSTGGPGLEYENSGAWHSTGTQTSNSTGSGSAHNVLDPYVTVNFIIKY